MRIERRVVFVFWVVFVVALTTPAWAGSVRTVCASGCEFASLQEAVDSSEWGATLQLGPGAYVENVVLRGALTIRGAGQGRTVIDGGSWDAALRLEGPLAYVVRLEDLTIHSGHRGGILTGVGEVSLERCVVSDAMSAGARVWSRGIAGQTDAVNAARAGATRRREDGVRSTASSGSSKGEQSTDTVSGGPSGRGLSDIVSASGDSGGKVTLCHTLPGNPENAQTITVGQAAVATHLAHGDSMGECAEACDGVPSPVPQTGQTDCWDESGNSVTCTGTGQDGEYQAGVSMDPRFTDNLDGTVTDNLTGLIWLQDASCLGSGNWTNGLADANALADGSCGLTDGSMASDWRLPNINELRSLIDYTQFSPAIPGGHPFSGVQSNLYWASTSVTGFPHFAWSANLVIGNIQHNSFKTGNRWVWPVRGGS